MSKRLLVLPILMTAVILVAAGHRKAAEELDGLPLVFNEDFEDGLESWEIIDPDTWRLADRGENTTLEITARESAYQPAVRSPKHIALIKDLRADDLIIEFRVRSTKDTGNHRDCCIFFNYQDPSHFYYVHLGAKPDPASGQIMIVNGEPRRPLTENTKRTPWTDDWHIVRLIRKADQGLIQVFFDDLQTPHMEITDSTFGRGRIGIGSFDDMNEFDDIRVYAR